MNDKLKNLIFEIEHNEKIISKSSDSSKVYSDEPIIYRASHMKNFLPEKYRQMKSLSPYLNFKGAGDAALFYRQGKFMEDFEDDYPYFAVPDFTLPTYAMLSDRQLRGYFSWRTNVRHDNIEQAPETFVYIYVYELINCIGAEEPAEAFSKLFNFYQAYDFFSYRIKQKISVWLFDMIIYYGLDSSFINFIGFSFNKEALDVLSDIRSFPAHKVFETVCSFSSYKAAESAFYKKYSSEFEETLYTVLSGISKNCNGGLLKKYFGEFLSSRYLIFSNAVFYDTRCYENYLYEVSPYLRYRCKNYFWSVERLTEFRKNNRELNELLKETDRVMREVFGFNRKIKAGAVPAEILGIIRETAAEIFERNKKPERTEIILNSALFGNIRSSAERTQKMLMTDEDELEEVPENGYNEKIEETVASESENCGIFSALEKEFIFYVLEEKDYNELLKNAGMRLSVIVDSINEKMFDEIADNVFDFNGDTPFIIGDYENEVKEAAGL